MSQIGMQYGWLLYCGSMGAGDLALAGDVYDVRITVEDSMYAPRLMAVSANLNRADVIQGKPESEAMWEALRKWPQPGKQGGRRWPPALRAMAELARRHPEEYRHLLAAEESREPLQVVRDEWLTGDNRV